MPIAFTRAVSPRLGLCELTHLPRQPINLRRAMEEHRNYEHCLRSVGCTIHRLPAEPELPDGVFVEDTAVILPEAAIITRPGASSRQLETQSVAKALSSYRELHTIEAPATLDGGDVLVIDRTVFVGQSTRSNQEAFEQLSDLLTPLGYDLVPVAVDGCLHLKSAVTYLGQDTVLINPEWVDASHFGAWDVLTVHPDEPRAANALLANGSLLYPARFGRTRERLKEKGFEVIELDVSELAKAEAGITCCSLILEDG